MNEKQARLILEEITELNDLIKMLRCACLVAETLIEYNDHNTELEQRELELSDKILEVAVFCDPRP